MIHLLRLANAVRGRAIEVVCPGLPVRSTATPFVRPARDALSTTHEVLRAAVHLLRPGRDLFRRTAETSRLACESRRRTSAVVRPGREAKSVHITVVRLTDAMSCLGDAP